MKSVLILEAAFIYKIYSSSWAIWDLDWKFFGTGHDGLPGEDHLNPPFAVSKEMDQSVWTECMIVKNILNRKFREPLVRSH